MKETEPHLKTNGEIALKDKFIAIETNIRFAFAAYAKAHSASFKLDCSGSGWVALKTLISVRNRVTHPKKIESLTITDEEIDSTAKALAFLSANHLAVQDVIVRKQLLDDGLTEEIVEAFLQFQNDLTKARNTDDRALVLKKFDAKWGLDVTM